MEYSKKLEVAKKVAAMLAEKEVTAGGLASIFQDVKDRLMVCMWRPMRYPYRMPRRIPDELDGKLAVLFEQSGITVNELEDILRYAKKQLVVCIRRADGQDGHACAKQPWREIESGEGAKESSIAEEVAGLLADERVTVYELPSIVRHVKDRLLVSERLPFESPSFRGAPEHEPDEIDEKVAMLLDKRMATVNEIDAIFAYACGLLVVRVKGGR